MYLQYCFEPRVASLSAVQQTIRQRSRRAILDFYKGLLTLWKSFGLTEAQSVYRLDSHPHYLELFRPAFCQEVKTYFG